MSEKAIAKLFAKLEEMSNQLYEMKSVVTRVAANSDLVYEGYQVYGGEIEMLKLEVQRLRLRCPLLKPATGESAKVDCDDDSR